MVKIKEMTYREKYTGVLSYIELLDFAKDFVAEHLGSEAVEELQKEWQQGIKPITADASDKEKYEIALSNWAWKGGAAYDLVLNRLGEAGIEPLIRDDAEALVKSIPRPAVLLLKFIRKVSPGMAFNMIAQQMVNQVQVAGPVSVSEPSRNKIVVDLPHCRLHDYPGSEGTCLFCQKAPPIAFREQFGVEIKTNRQENGCKVSLSL